MLGDVVRRYRLARGLKQEMLAARAGTTQSVISKIERGVRTNLTREVLERLATALDVPLAELIHAVELGAEGPNGRPPAARLDIPAPGSCPPVFAETLARVGPYLTPRAWELLAAYAEGLAAEDLSASAAPVPLPDTLREQLRRLAPDLASNLPALTGDPVYFRFAPRDVPLSDS